VKSTPLDYAEFIERKDGYLKSSPLRLDCMKPVKSLSHLIPPPARNPKKYNEQEAFEAWQGCVGLDASGYTPIFGSGVKSLIGMIFEALSKYESKFPINDHEVYLHLPEDVWPVYFELSKGLEIETYQTFPELTFAPSRNLGKSVVLMPAPLSPAGAFPTGQECELIMTWLAVAPCRLLILDTVYAFSKKFNHILTRFLETKQCIVLSSLSKQWLLPGQFGVALGHNDIMEELNLKGQEIHTFDWVDRICECPDLPANLDSRFQTEWKRLSAQLNKIDPGWKPPDTGYFSTLRISFEELLEHNILGVPSSVFGSSEEGTTVMSCLFNMNS